MDLWRPNGRFFCCQKNQWHPRSPRSGWVSNKAPCLAPRRLGMGHIPPRNFSWWWLGNGLWLLYHVAPTLDKTIPTPRRASFFREKNMARDYLLCLRLLMINSIVAYHHLPQTLGISYHRFCCVNPASMINISPKVHIWAMSNHHLVSKYACSWLWSFSTPSKNM